ncbi:hypothetical protein [Pedobacter arcticus]|uniref:hypothetical protein n=1 Tax=Pedobacter arcticus TaxID=752140 RepID=UPI000319E59D|nr:hypothetical protein [Pedobacter arcticus]
MMETLTPTLNSIVNDEEMSQRAINMLSTEDVEFYENLKPALNNLVKSPSEDIVNRILAFSKTF